MVQVSLKRGNWWDVAYFPRFVYVGKMPHFPETLKNGACIWYFSGFVMVVFSKTDAQQTETRDLSKQNPHQQIPKLSLPHFCTDPMRTLAPQMNKSTI